MLRSVVFTWLLSVLCITVVAQNNGCPPFDPDCTATGTDTSTKTSQKQGATTSSSGTLGQTTSNAAAGGGGGGGNTAAVGSATPSAQLISSASQAIPTVTGEPTIGSGNNAAQSSGPASQPTASLSEKSRDGMPTSTKAGVGVGIGLGIPIIAGALALLFLLRRRRNNRYGSERSSAAQYRNQPGMSSNAPALAGMSEMGRSPSKHWLPRTPSQHSLVAVPPPPPPPEPTIIPPSQHPLARGPSQHSMAHDFPEQKSLMPAPPPYEEAPSPLEENDDEPISPVSPISPADSRPPSPMNDHGR